MFDRRDVKREKSAAYLQLVEACHQDGCPICTLLQQSTHRFLASILYESVTDPTSRAHIRKARGFCNWHAWFLTREVQNSMQGIAIIYHDLLTQEIEDLQTLLTKHALRPHSLFRKTIFSSAALERYRRRWKHKTPCPACEWVQWEEQYALEILCESFDNPVLQLALSQSAGLCVPHLRQTILIGPSSPYLPRLLELHRQKYHQLAAELQEFDRKHDYRFVHEPWGPEADSWRRVIEQCVGKRELFGNEISRSSSGRHSTRQWRFFQHIWRWIRKKSSAFASL